MGAIPSDASESESALESALDSASESAAEREDEGEWDTALQVPLLYLQAATLPLVDLMGVEIAGANFRLAPPSWLRWHEHIERDPASSPHMYMRCNYTVAALRTVDNPSPLDSVLFYIPAAAPATEEEEMADAVVRVLAGDRKVSKAEALAVWFTGIGSMRHVPDAPEAILRDMKPAQIPIVLEGDYFFTSDSDADSDHED